MCMSVDRREETPDLDGDRFTYILIGANIHGAWVRFAMRLPFTPLSPDSCGQSTFGQG